MFTLEGTRRAIPGGWVINVAVSDTGMGIAAADQEALGVRGGQAMTYGFRPENWATFQRELRARGITVNDIEKVEIQPRTAEGAAGVPTGTIGIAVTLRSGRVETWSQPHAWMA